MIVITGRTRSGKDTVAKYLVENLGYKFIVTYTDRPMRKTEQDGREHHFITEEEMDELFKSDDVVLRTHIVDPVLQKEIAGYKGYRYCTKSADLTDESVIILDTNGVRDLEKTGKEFILIKVVSSYKNLQERAKESGIEKSVFEKRYMDEEAQFTENNRGYSGLVIENNGTLKDLYRRTDALVKSIRK